MRLILCVLAGLVLGNQAMAEESHNYVVAGGELNPSQTAFVDSNSIRRQGDQVIYQTLWIFGTPQKFSSTTVAFFLRQDIDDCSKNLNRQTKAAAFDIDGKQIIMNVNSSTPMISIVAGSVGETMHSFVCFGKVPYEIPLGVNSTIHTIDEARQAAKLIEALH